MTKKKKKFIPTIKVLCDDLFVEDEEGEKHYPHAGEWVRFRRGVPLRVMRVAGQAAELEKSGISENAAEYASVIGDLIKVIARQIIDWNWTGEDGELLPRPIADRPAFIEALWDLDDHELTWIQKHLADGARVEKN